MKVAQFPDYRKDNPYQHLLADALAKHGVEVFFPHGYRRGLPFSRALAGEPNVDVLHLHWFTPYLRGQSYPAQVAYASKLLVDLRLAKARGVRLVWTVHNLVSHETTFPELENWLSRRVAALVDALIVHSEGAKVAVINQFKVRAEKISIIPHGDFADAYGKKMPRALARQRLGLDQEIPVFLFFGMIRPYKGVESLLKVWKQSYLLHQRGVLIIAGDARDMDLATSVSLAVTDNPNVYLHMRFIADDEVPIFFGAADYAVFPFTQSLTSGSFALARTYSVPVVAAKTEGTVADGAHAGSFFFESNNTHALMSTMQTALALVSSCRRASPDSPSGRQWDWPAIANLHQEVYRDRHPNMSLT